MSDDHESFDEPIDLASPGRKSGIDARRYYDRLMEERRLRKLLEDEFA